MTTRIALTTQKPAIVNDFTFCMCSVCQAASAGNATKSLSEFAFTSAQLSAIASGGTVAVRVPSTINDPALIVGADRVQSTSDSDFFAVSLVKGQTYSFSLRGTGATPLSDPLLALFADPEGDGFALQT